MAGVADSSRSFYGRPIVIERTAWIQHQPHVIPIFLNKIWTAFYKTHEEDFWNDSTDFRKYAPERHHQTEEIQPKKPNCINFQYPTKTDTALIHAFFRKTGTGVAHENATSVHFENPSPLSYSQPHFGIAENIFCFAVAFSCPEI